MDSDRLGVYEGVGVRRPEKVKSYLSQGGGSGWWLLGMP